MLKKTIKALLIVLSLVIIVLLVLPIVIKPVIERSLRKEINSQINAKADFDNLSISVFRHFPDAAFSLTNFTIVGQTAGKPDTIVRVGELLFSVNLNSIFRGNRYQLTSLKIENPRINALVDSEGKANWEILKKPLPNANTPLQPSAEPNAANFELHANAIIIEGAEIRYEDVRKKLLLTAAGYDFKGSADAKNDLLDFTTDSKIKSITLQIDSVEYLHNDKLSGQIHFSIATIDSGYNILSSNINLRGAEFQINGYIKNSGNETQMDLKILFQKQDFKNLLALFPVANFQFTKGMNISGMVNAKAEIKGRLRGKEHPSLAINLNSDSCDIQLSDGKGSFKHIALEMDLNKSGGLGDTISMGCKITGLFGGELRGDARCLNRPHKQLVVFHEALKRGDIQQAVKATTYLKAAPILQHMHGNFNLTIEGNFQLDSSFRIIENSLMISGRGEARGAQISEVPALMEISTLANIPSLQNLTAANAWAKFRFNNQVLNVDSSDIKFTNQYEITSQGWSNTLTSKIDYQLKLTVPDNVLGATVSKARNLLAQFGLQISIPKAMNFQFHISGDAKNPDLKLLNFAAGNKQ